MQGIGEKIWKWVERVKLVFDVVLAILGERLVRKLLSYIPQISKDWASIIALASAALILFELIKLQERRAIRQAPVQAETAQISSSAPTTTFPALSSLIPGLPKPTFDAEAFFKASYFSPLTAEAQKNVQIMANEKQPEDPANFLARFIGVGLVSYLHQHAWFTIFKSQILLLQDLNRRNVPIADAKGYYDKAVLERPSFYTGYSFEQWILYMTQEQLVLRHPSDMLEITFKGKDFLKYLTHWGYDINIKAG